MSAQHSRPRLLTESVYLSADTAASKHQGATWRTDFELIFERTATRDS
jgi:hypothetical protein